MQSCSLWEGEPGAKGGRQCGPGRGEAGWSLGEAHELPPVSGCEPRHLLINDAVRRAVASKRVLQKMLGSLWGCRQLLGEDDVSQGSEKANTHQDGSVLRRGGQVYP